jgi:hypothetical protein
MDIKAFSYIMAMMVFVLVYFDGELFFLRINRKRPPEIAAVPSTPITPARPPEMRSFSIPSTA